MEDTGHWRSITEQVELLRSRGVVVDDVRAARDVLDQVGHHRLTVFLHPFREVEDEGLPTEVHTYRPGTRFTDAVRLLEYDRSLRLLVIDGVERIELAFRSRTAQVLSQHGAYAHEDSSLYRESFTAVDPSTGTSPHGELLARTAARTASADEARTARSRGEHDRRLRIWALVEVLELGMLSRLYRGLRNDVASEVARSFDVPSKRLFQSWIASVNYVRNVAAHHARLFNRRLVTAPKRPGVSAVPLLAHLSERPAAKPFGVYDALAVMAYLMRSLPDGPCWTDDMAVLLSSFPRMSAIDASSMGVPVDALREPLWTSPRTPLASCRSREPTPGRW